MDGYLFQQLLEIIRNLCISELPVLKAIQGTFEAYDWFLDGISDVFSTLNIVCVVFPILHAVNEKQSLLLLGCATVSDWMNLIMKLFLRGDRPYWFVGENQLGNLRQSRITCETGSGNPSGHSMIGFVLFYVLMDSVVQFSHRKLDPAFRALVKRLAWNGFVAGLGLVFLSRTFCSAHFPHQVLFGFAFGYLMILKGYKSKWLETSSNCLVAMAVFVLVSSLICYAAVDIFFASSGGAGWSIGKAVKWCAKKEWIHVKTTSLSSMMLYSGNALGLAVGMSGIAAVGSDPRCNYDGRFVAEIFGGLMAGGLLRISYDWVTSNVANHALGHLVTYFLFTLYTWVIVKGFGKGVAKA